MHRSGPMTTFDRSIDRALAGDQRALSRLLTRIENDPEAAVSITNTIYPLTGRAHVIGITGAPGAGKSSVLGRLAIEVSKRGQRIAIIAVDPTSPRSGGATLGDRIRMSGAVLDPNVFVRSLASRYRHDGLAPAVADASLLFDAAGYDYVAIETVGSGQDQLEIADLVHSTVLVQIPGAGDSVQLLKAGSMEIADIYVVNKADLPGATQVARDLRAILRMAPEDGSGWTPPIVLTSANDATGFDTLLDAIDRHRRFLEQHELLTTRRERIARSELRRAVARQVRLDDPDQQVHALIESVTNRKRTPEEAARELLRVVVARYDDR